MKVVRRATECRHHDRAAHRRPVSRLARRACSFGSSRAHGARQFSGFIPSAFAVIATAGPRAGSSLAESLNARRVADIDARLRDGKIIVTVNVVVAVVLFSWGIIVPEKLILPQSCPHPLPLRSWSMCHREESFRFDLYELPGSRSTRIRLSGQVQGPPSPRSLQHWLTPMARWSEQPVELVLSAEAGTVGWFECWGDVTAVVPSDLLSVRFVDSRRIDRWMRGR